MKITHNIVIGVLSLLLLFSTAAIAFAIDKTLEFEGQNGKMVMNSIRSDEGNWFMDFDNMLPGVKYHDQLSIQNKSRKTFELYMQAVPVEQEQIEDDLLDMIYMDVRFDGNTIYSGIASGKPYEGSRDLRNVILLGKYKPGESGVITTSVVLDKNAGIEYCDILTRVDWKLMVREINSDKVIVPSPKTGDETRIWPFAVLALVALGTILVLFRRRK